MGLSGWILPPRYQERLLLERWYVHDFVRQKMMPRLSREVTLLDAGAGRLPEQFLRDELLQTGTRLETLDLFGGPGVDHVGDISAMPFADNAYDHVLCTQVLEHVTDPQKVCKELCRVVKPGGYVGVTAPQSSHLHNLPYHFFHFTHLGMRQMLERSGLEVLEITPQGGHFAYLAMQLHLTCALLPSEDPKWWKKGLLKVSRLPLRLLLGFAVKVPMLVLDRLLPLQSNTQGWCALCRKPSA